MYYLLVGIYIVVTILLTIAILMQSGRGGGLVETFSGAESIFGGKTNIYMVRITMVLGALFLGFAIGLNAYVAKRSRSIMERFQKKAAKVMQNEAAQPAQTEEKGLPVDVKPAEVEVKDVPIEQEKQGQVEAKAAEEALEQPKETPAAEEPAPAEVTEGESQ